MKFFAAQSTHAAFLSLSNNKFFPATYVVRRALRLSVARVNEIHFLSLAVAGLSGKKLRITVGGGEANGGRRACHVHNKAEATHGGLRVAQGSRPLNPAGEEGTHPDERTRRQFSPHLA